MSSFIKCLISDNQGLSSKNGTLVNHEVLGNIRRWVTNCSSVSPGGRRSGTTAAIIISQSPPRIKETNVMRWMFEYKFYLIAFLRTQSRANNLWSGTVVTAWFNLSAWTWCSGMIEFWLVSVACFRKMSVSEWQSDNTLTQFPFYYFSETTLEN